MWWIYWIYCHTLIDFRLCPGLSTATSVYFGAESSKLVSLRQWGSSDMKVRWRGSWWGLGSHESGEERGIAQVEKFCAIVWWSNGGLKGKPPMRGVLSRWHQHKVQPKAAPALLLQGGCRCGATAVDHWCQGGNSEWGGGDCEHWGGCRRKFVKLLCSLLPRLPQCQ